MMTQTNDDATLHPHLCHKLPLFITEVVGKRWARAPYTLQVFLTLLGLNFFVGTDTKRSAHSLFHKLYVKH